MDNDFDKFSNNYSEILDKNIKDFSQYNGEYYQEYKIKLISENTTPAKILDFGCGTGIGCKYLKKYFPASEITGIDVSEKSIEKAKENKEADFFTYDGENIPFENKFDIIYSSCVFHHIEKTHHKALIQELLKALKKDGKIYIFEHNPFNPVTKKLVKECVFDKDAELVYPHEFKKLTKCKINYIFFVPRFKFLEKIFFIEKYLTKLPLGAQYCCVIEKFQCK